jgi:hypothetical protein
VNIFFLLALLGLFAGEVWTLFARPSKAALAVAISGAAVFSGLAVLVLGWVAGLGRFEALEYYSLPLDPAGTQTVRIRPLKGIPGLSAVPVPKEARPGPRHVRGAEAPVPMDRVLRCGWRLKGMDARWHLCGEKCPCAPKRAIFDTGWDLRFENGTFTGVELEYEVNAETRPILESIELEVGAPIHMGAETAAVASLGFGMGIALILGAAAGVAGLFVQIARRRAEGP